jgi:hypothetical protein
MPIVVKLIVVEGKSWMFCIFMIASKYILCYNHIPHSLKFTFPEIKEIQSILVYFSYSYTLMRIVSLAMPITSSPLFVGASWGIKSRSNHEPRPAKCRTLAMQPPNAR